MKKILMLCAALLLARCGDDVPPDVLAAPRAVTVPTPATRQAVPWPRLGDVPSKPTDLPAPATIQQNIKEIEGGK